ncbi:MAG: hypothetical protein KDD02_11265 [Phaeodactylibacter sp.]|nr:hypothetical protein [Phaeodactylibacter sp.]
MIINKNKIRPAKLVRYPFKGSSKLGALYEGIIEGNFNTDEQAMENLYGSENKSAYRKLKSTLRNRLLNTLFFIDVKEASYNSYQKAYYECYRDWAAIKILLGKSARNSAVTLALKVLRYAEKYEFSSLCRDLSDMLRFHYGAIEGDFKKYEEFDKIYQSHTIATEYENLAKELYLKLVIHFVNGRSVKEEIHQQAKEAYAQLEEVLKNCYTHDLHLYAFLIKLIIYTSINDHVKTVDVCQQAIVFFSGKGFEAQVPLQIFYYQKMACYLQLRQFEKGKETAEFCLDLMEEGSYNWFKYLELYFILSMHTAQYRQAYLVFVQASGHSRFKFLPENVRELWRIYEAYVHYLKVLGEFKPGRKDPRLNKFRLGRFLNQTTIYSKDKEGLNISILVVQILFFILKKDYGKAGDHIQAIEQYCQRYLKKGETYRSSCFIKMLLQIPKANYHKAAVTRKAAKYLAKLKEVPIEVAGQSYEVEILPYEALWKMAMRSLENTFYHQRGRRNYTH